jgi:hypothetical protein
MSWWSTAASWAQSGRRRWVGRRPGGGDERVAGQAAATSRASAQRWRRPGGGDERGADRTAATSGAPAQRWWRALSFADS